MDRKSKDHLNNKRKTPRMPKGEKAPKKVKTELAFMCPDVFEKRMMEVIRRAVEIFHDCNHDVTEGSERVAYLTILKRICNSHSWANHRIITTDIQVKCFTEKAALTQGDLKKFQQYSNNWIEYQASKFSGKTKIIKYEAAASHYKRIIFSFGVKPDTIESKITECRGVSKEREKSLNLNKSESLDKATAETRQRNNDYSIDVCGSCRLCGCKDSRLVINLSEKCRGDDMLKDLVESFCR